jgi:hypothetical protein
MSSFSEQDSIDPDNPELDYTPLRLSERAAKLGPLVSQGARSETIVSSPMFRPALLAPNAISEPAGRTHDLDRRAALSGLAVRAAAVAGVVALVAALFVIMKPTSRQSVASSIPSDITGSTSSIPPQFNQADVESKPALTELKAPPSQPTAYDESPPLLQRFLQWREKANTTDPTP